MLKMGVVLKSPIDRRIFQCYAAFQQMLKEGYSMKEPETERGLQEAFLACLREVPFVRDVRVRTGWLGGPDLEADVRFRDDVRRFLVEFKSSGQPRMIREAVNQLLRYRADASDAHLVIAAPYISPESAELCRREGVGYVDLAGNCLLCFDQVYIRREGNPNPFAAKRDLRSLYSPKASRVIRVLLTDPFRVWKMEELAEASGVSLGQAHNVKKLLADREWIEGGQRGFSLRFPERLLDEWSENYDYRRNRAVEFYTMRSVSEIEYDVVAACQEANRRCALTGFSAAARLAPFVRYQRAAIYVDGAIEQIASKTGLKRVSSGGNLNLITPYDEGVFYGATELNGITIVSAIQAYLDVKSVPSRGEEAADFLRREVILPKWHRAA